MDVGIAKDFGKREQVTLDKYEYKVRSDEIKNLIAEGEFVKAAEIADSIDWRRVKSVMMLCTISDLYRINRRYEDAKNMLLLAYERKPGGRTICYSLCELCIKTEEFVQAINYYKEYVQAAPKDSGRYILQYKLYEAQEVSLEERISVLEELKKKDYREKWAYELAYLYHRVGLATRCVEECDELILWFGDGKYVVKAMELKMLHEPLTPSQQERYDHRFDETPQQVEEAAYTGDGEGGYRREEGGQYQEDSQWPGYERASQEGYEESLGEDRWKGYEQSPGEDRWKGYEQSPGEDRWEGNEQSQGEGSWEGYGQSQREGKWEGYGQSQREGRWEGYGQSPGEGRWEGYGQSQGEGSWEGYEQSQGEDRWEGNELPQEEDQWEGYEAREDGRRGNQYYSERNHRYPDREQEASDDELDIQVKTIDVGQYNTINLQAELAAGLKEVLGTEEITQAIIAPMMHSDTEAMEDAAVGESAAEPDVMEETEVFFGETGEVGKVQQEIAIEQEDAAEGFENEAADSRLEPSAQVNLYENGVEEERLVRPKESGEKVKDVQLFETGERKWKLPEVEEIPSGEEMFVRDDTAELVLAQMRKEGAGTGRATEGSGASEIEMHVGDEPHEGSGGDTASRMIAFDAAQVQPPREMAEVLSLEADGQIGMVLPEQVAIEKQITGQMRLEDILAEWERTKKSNEEKCREDVRRHVRQETDNMFTEFESAIRDGLLERLEKGETIGEEEVRRALGQESESEKRSDGRRPYNAGVSRAENSVQSGERAKSAVKPRTNRVQQDMESEDLFEELEKEGLLEGVEPTETIQVPEVDELWEEEVQEPLARMASVREPEEAEVECYDAETVNGQETYLEAEELLRNAETARELEESEAEALLDEVETADGLEGFGEEAAEELLRNAETARELEESEAEALLDEVETADGLEGFGEEAAEELLRNAETAQELEESEAEALLDRVETAEAFGETVAEELQEEAEPARTFGEEAAEASEGIEDGEEEPSIEREVAKIRGLTREEKELFAPFIQSRAARENLVKAIDNISMAAYTGNLVVTGEEGMDTMTFAKNMIRELQMIDSNFSGKVAKISGQGFNQRNVEETLWHLNNGALIIYQASGMTPQTAAALHQQLQQENLGIVVILEDTKKAMQKMFLGTPELFGDFTAKMELEALSNDTLVSFGRRYAREMEYSIDDLGVLALHTRIEELQTIDHVVTVVEVKKIVDEAIRHACKKTLGHFFDILFAKRYDGEDMIILTEKDFA